MVNEADHANWTREQLRPYALHALEVFGVQRMMFGSDWFVCTLAATYRQWLDTAQAIVNDLSPEEQQRIFYDSTVQFYDL